MAIAPYHIYTLTLTEGVNTQFLQMKPTKAVFYDGETIDVKIPERMDDERLYQSVHFGHFEMPIPINHSLFSLIPIIRIEAAGHKTWGEFFKTLKTQSFLVL